MAVARVRANEWESAGESIRLVLSSAARIAAALDYGGVSHFYLLRGEEEKEREDEVMTLRLGIRRERWDWSVRKDCVCG